MEQNVSSIPDSGEVVPLQVNDSQGVELFRITPDLKFEWGEDLDIDETARLLAEAVTVQLNRGPFFVC